MSNILTDALVPSLKDKATVKDSGWTNLPTQSGWSSLHEVPLAYRKLTFPGGGGIVYLRGLLRPVEPTNSVVATLPTGYRPARATPFINFVNGTGSDGGVGNTLIGIDGHIYTYVPSTSWDWVSFNTSFLTN